jgi:DNA-binding PadR family transcriptional regulator
VGTDRDRGIDRRLPLRRVEFHILLSLAAGERHGYGIIQDIEARRPAPDTSEERRNYYRITSAGMRVARAEARRLEALMSAARVGGLLPKEVK